MRLVIDTNVLLSALIADSLTRRLILLGKHELYYPEVSLGKINKYQDMVMGKTGMGEKEFELALSMLLSKVERVASIAFKHKIKEAERVMRGIDPEDALFVALALSIPDCRIWSNDKHLKKQNLVKVYTTKEILGI